MNERAEAERPRIAQIDCELLHDGAEILSRATLQNTGFHVQPYHANVPSFGEWGFAPAKRERFEPPSATPPAARYLNAPALRALFVFPPDMQAVPVEDNRLDSQVLVRYYESE